MNGVDFIASAFGRGIDKLTNIIGKWGSSQPADDSKSGIKIGDEIYQVVVSLNGCYWYIDESGKKQPISGIPATTEWEWINIAEKVLRDFKTCYRTLGGKVEVWSWFLMNDKLEVLKETHRITDSTDMDNPTGSILEEIPSDWVMIDCDLPDMTERDITPVSRCYRTPGGKVQIEGIESIDDKNTIRESIYSVIQSTDESFPEGYQTNLIPNDWERIVCDFPDMTARNMEKVDECYSTPGGKVHLRGYRAFDNVLMVRVQYLIVAETMDPDISRGETISNIPEDWERIICDFPDATTADTEIVENCYRTENGKVMIRTYLTFDGDGNTRSQKHVILRSTDSAYSVGDVVSEIPSLWLNIECDFASASQRHIKSLKNCYESESGRIYVEGFAVIDNSLNWESMTLVVMESTDSSIEVGSAIYSIPDGYKQVACKCNCCN